MRPIILIPLLALLLIIAVIIAAHFGAAKLPLSAWTCQEENCQSAAYILWQIRLPRIIGALLIGAALSISGVAMQGLFRNPLVEPGIIGVSAGAGLFAALYIVLITQKNLYGLPLAAFLGGWLTTTLLYLLSKRHGQLHIAIMLLTGIAIAAFAGAITGILVYLSDDQQLRSLSFWSMGSLSGMNWTMVALLSFALFITFPLILKNARALNALSLGEDSAQYIGFAIDKIKKRLILYTALLTGFCVAFAGGIAFIGLVVPHLMRLAGGYDHRYLLPNSLLCGASLLLFADTLSRTLAAPAEIPIGIFTALFGAPFLALLVWKSSNKL